MYIHECVTSSDHMYAHDINKHTHLQRSGQLWESKGKYSIQWQNVITSYSSWCSTGFLDIWLALDEVNKGSGEGDWQNVNCFTEHKEAIRVEWVFFRITVFLWNCELEETMFVSEFIAAFYMTLGIYTILCIYVWNACMYVYMICMYVCMICVYVWGCMWEYSYVCMKICV